MKKSDTPAPDVEAVAREIVAGMISSARTTAEDRARVVVILRRFARVGDDGTDD